MIKLPTLIGLAFAILLIGALTVLTISTSRSPTPAPNIPEKAAMQMAREVAYPTRSRLTAPQTLGDLRQVQVVRGTRAIEEIEALHRLSLDLTDGLVAHYQGSGGRATLWIATASTAERAATMIRKMNAKLQPGHPIFQGWQALQRRGIPLYYVTGMGQQHYYFGHGVSMYWLGVDEAVAEEALKDLLTSLEK